METFCPSDAPRQGKYIALRFIIVVIIFSTLVLDGTLRFIPPDWIASRAWDAALLYASAEGPFAPNFHFSSDRTYGDLIKMGNLPSSYRRLHREVFTTDAFGFRNSPAAAATTPEILVVGDSFAVGSGVSDQDTLSSQLSYLTGKAVYNGATGGSGWATTKALIDRLHLRKGWVVWELSESHYVPSFTLEQLASRANSSYRAPPETFRNQARWVHDFWSYSPLRILVQRALLSVEDDVWLPNPLHGAVLIERLKDGNPMLFLPSQVDKFYHHGHEDTQYFSHVNALIRDTGNKLVVVLVPSKYLVYQPLLSHPGPSPDLKSHWDQFQEDLQRAGIATVNLTSDLRMQAVKDLPSGKYDYFVDDTHWNQSGIHVGAVAISKYLGSD